MRIVFAGTPEFTLPSLNALIQTQHQLVAVYTQPDRPAGRGRQLHPSPVKNWALAHQLPLYQPDNFKSAEVIHDLSKLKPDIIIVIAYGLILPKKVLSIPRFGCINVHASLLPRWRGASPIQQAILQGDKETGITIMQMDEGMDTGDCLLRKTCSIFPDDNLATLQERLAALAVEPLLQTIDDLALNRVNFEKQDHSQATYAAKIKKEEAKIDWRKSALEIDQQIRAFNPWPIAYTIVGDEVLRIHRAEVVPNTSLDSPGTIIALDKKGLLVATGNQALKIEIIQFPGSKAMNLADWLNAKRSQLHINQVLQ